MIRSYRDPVFNSVELAGGAKLFVGPGGTTIIATDDGGPISIQTSPSGRAFLSENTTETVINTQNEWVNIAGAWEGAHLNAVTANGGGGLQYTGEVVTQIQYLAGGSYLSPSNNAEYEIAMFLNDELKERTVQSFSPPRQNERLALPLITGFTDTTAPDDTHRVRVRCTNGTTNITIPAINFTVKG